MEREPHIGLLGNGHDPPEEVLEVLPQPLFRRQLRLRPGRRLEHLGVVVLGDEGAAAGRHGQPGAGPAVDGDPVVTEHRYADGPHGAELLAEQIELLLAPGTPEPDVVHRRRVLDRDEREARVLVARLQQLERRTAPAAPLLGEGTDAGRSSRCDSLRTQRIACSASSRRLTTSSTPTCLSSGQRSVGHVRVEELGDPDHGVLTPPEPELGLCDLLGDVPAALDRDPGDPAHELLGRRLPLGSTPATRPWSRTCTRSQSS